ncbi:MAG TPA: hypothetical protein VMD51_15410 [Mycobacterium sp.]|nr:hypothetical protein [Mycobacterium sp.]
MYSLLSPLTVVDSTFTGNKTLARGGAGDGGAIGTDGAAPLTPGRVGGQIRLCGSTFTRNVAAHGSGGGVYLWACAADRVVVERSTFQENTIDGIGGGARVSVGPTDWGTTGSITISGVSILSNTSTGNGGGLYLDCAPTCTVENSTLYANTSKAYGGGPSSAPAPTTTPTSRSRRTTSTATGAPCSEGSSSSTTPSSWGTRPGTRGGRR